MSLQKFDTISYLMQGNERQRKASHSLIKYKVMEILQDFTPLLVGTIPIEIDIESSDLDIICCWKDKQQFMNRLSTHFASFPHFDIVEKEVNGECTVIAHFYLDSFEIEIFGQNRPVKEQHGYRHMIVEHALLEQYGIDFKTKIIELKKQGLKTEPAFAMLLALEGNPYSEMLALYDQINENGRLLLLPNNLD